MKSFKALFAGISLGFMVLLVVCFYIDKQSFIPILALFSIITLTIALLLKQKNEDII